MCPPHGLVDLVLVDDDDLPPAWGQIGDVQIEVLNEIECHGGEASAVREACVSPTKMAYLAGLPFAAGRGVETSQLESVGRSGLPVGSDRMAAAYVQGFGLKASAPV